MQLNQKRTWIAGGILVVLLVIFAICAVRFLPETDQGKKTIEVEVVYADESSDEFTIKTEEEFLRGALEQEELVAGTESDYGLYIQTVNGVSADESNQEWWAISKDEEELTTGADTTPIADGEHYELTLKTGW